MIELSLRIKCVVSWGFSLPSAPVAFIANPAMAIFFTWSQNAVPCR